MVSMDAVNTLSGAAMELCESMDGYGTWGSRGVRSTDIGGSDMTFQSWDVQQRYATCTGHLPHVHLTTRDVRSAHIHGVTYER